MTLRHLVGNERDTGVVEEICGYLTSIPPKSFFLFAGAGSGKTRTLVEVLRRLTGVEFHESGSKFANRIFARGQSIRVITYTRNAVAVINGRLGENDLTKVSTIHAFCWDLIAGFDDDIREALLDLNSKELQKVHQTAESRKRGYTDKDKRTIEELMVKAATLTSIPHFIYNPDRNTYGEGALQHAQVLDITAWLIDNRPTLRRSLIDRHPLILIDESQDTMKGMLDVLIKVAREEPLNLILGFIGDHRQRIYMDGHQDLPSYIPAEWARPKLEMNHRSQQRIVDLINCIWEAELNGRTQPATGVRQYARTEKSGGIVRIYVGGSNLASEEKICREVDCAKKMVSISKHEGWSNPNGGYQVLALEHKLAAQRGGFLDAFNALLLIDPDATRPQGNGENTGPASVRVILREAQDLAACVDSNGGIDEFAAIEILNRYGRLRDLSDGAPNLQSRLALLHQSVMEFATASFKPEATVRDILKPIVQHKLFNLDDRLVAAYLDMEPPPTAPVRSGDESIEDRRRRGWHDLFNTLWAEIRRYQTYLEGRSSLATHQVVKGSEFEHVMVVMDDQEAAGFLFSYDKLFGAKPLSPTDQANVAGNNETTVDRTLRLLYVTCSRARESLALVLWSSDPEKALENIKLGGWFTDTEIERIS
ncbi:UvrD-helicase domain-containing protein [Methylomonas sp. TEB]|uniref:UvrD-helicase domain-containing protein n=1 Tax=Methylomonas sp. TEB TaxID=3398229 RepID=UPI0039F632B0